MPDKRQLELFIATPLSKVMLSAAVPVVARRIGLGEDVPLVARVLNQRLTDPECYRSVLIPKKRGGYRGLDIPNKELMWVQRCIHHALLKRHYRPTPICHSFVAKSYDKTREHGKRWLVGRTIVSGAFAHLGVPPETEPDPEDEGIAWREPRSLFGVDLKDAYPTVGYERVLEIYEELAGDPWTAHILTWLSTWNGCLPQGAPTSPLLFNLACRELDAALQEEFGREPFDITRYADDIVLTSLRKGIAPRKQEKLVRIIEQNGFRVNRVKDVYWRDHKHALRVTGLNLKPEERAIALPAPVVDRFRSVLFHVVRALRKIRREKVLGEYCIKVLGEVDPEFSETDLRSFKKAERRLLGRVGGIAGLCHMIYGEEELLPRRLYWWLVRDELTALDLLPAVEESTEPADLDWAMRQLAGYD